MKNFFRALTPRAEFVHSTGIFIEPPELAAIPNVFARTTLLAFAVCCFFLTPGRASVITFDDAITGATSNTFDSDGDAVDDVIFSTLDPAGFSTFGPGPNMTHISEPGLEGTTSLPIDLRVAFLNGAITKLSVGFAMSTGTENKTATFRVYDSGNNLLAAATKTALFTPTVPGPFSSFPEGYIELAFPGTAAYAEFDFTDDAGRYIIDNFEGTFGSTEVPRGVPDSGATLSMLALSLLGIHPLRRMMAA